MSRKPLAYMYQRKRRNRSRCLIILWLTSLAGGHSQFLCIYISSEFPRYEQ